MQIGNASGHGIAESWDGNAWIHSDPTWNSFDNHQIYNTTGYARIYITHFDEADDSYNTQDPEDPTGDGVLRYENFRTRFLLREVMRYNQSNFMSKVISLVILGLFITVLVCSIPAGAIQGPLPGQGNQTLILYGVHPNAKNNVTITSFIAEHGEIWWHESGYNRTHEYVHIRPVNECREQLVYLNRAGADEHNNEPSIVFVKVIVSGETLPIEPVDPFSDLFQKHPALGEDDDLRSYIESHSPDRYKELEAGSSQSEVYFVDDMGMFTEYIVVLKKGKIDSGTYLSEDNLTINRAEAIRQALSEQPGDALIESTLLKIHDDSVYWELVVLKGPVADIIYIPAGMNPENSPGRTPGFGVLIAFCGIIAGLMFSRNR